MDKLLEIKNLCVEIEGKPILRGLDLSIGPGEIHAIMGPNGSGKSTLAKVLAGHPSYEVVDGSVSFQGNDLLSLEPEERAHLGLFMSFQYPIEIQGVSNRDFLEASLSAVRKARKQSVLSSQEIQEIVERASQRVGLSSLFQDRSLNEGFSGGEKKKNEILQMALLEPSLAVLDETDSGLDIDAIRIVAQGIEEIRQERPELSLLLITHYQRLLDSIKPHFVHVFVDGKIIKTGPASLALELEARGYA